MCHVYNDSTKNPGVVGVESSLCSRVVELIFPGPIEAALDSLVAPQSLNHGRQLRRHHAFLGRARQSKQLPGVVLSGETNIGETRKKTKS